MKLPSYVSLEIYMPKTYKLCIKYISHAFTWHVAGRHDRIASLSASILLASLAFSPKLRCRTHTPSEIIISAQSQHKHHYSFDAISSLSLALALNSTATHAHAAARAAYSTLNRFQPIWFTQMRKYTSESNRGCLAKSERERGENCIWI